MLVGVPKEIKDNEFRVGMTPAAVAELVHHGHRGDRRDVAPASGPGSPTRNMSRAGAEIVADGRPRYSRAPEMIVKVKEPLAEERKRLRARADPVHLPASRARSASRPAT